MTCVVMHLNKSWPDALMRGYAEGDELERAAFWTNDLVKPGWDLDDLAICELAFRVTNAPEEILSAEQREIAEHYHSQHRSLSVGDLIQIARPGEPDAFYACESIGFRKVDPPGGAMSTVYEMTRAALAETAPARVLAAYDAIPPNRVGHPVIGLLGFMSRSDLLILARAADLAHRRAGTEGWETQDEHVRARTIELCGSWRSASDTWQSALTEAREAYRQAIQQIQSRPQHEGTTGA